MSLRLNARLKCGAIGPEGGHTKVDTDRYWCELSGGRIEQEYRHIRSKSILWWVGSESTETQLSYQTPHQISQKSTHKGNPSCHCHLYMLIMLSPAQDFVKVSNKTDFI